MTYNIKTAPNCRLCYGKRFIPPEPGGPSTLCPLCGGNGATLLTIDQMVKSDKVIDRLADEILRTL